MPHDDTTLTMLRTDAALREREARIVELERELAQARAELDTMRRTATAIADERSHIATELFHAQRTIGIADRMARYLGWAFEQNLILRNETKELLSGVLREWKEPANA